MGSNKLIWLGMFIGSAVGSYVPALWGDSMLSFWSIILTAFGGIVGIWIGFKLSN